MSMYHGWIVAWAKASPAEAPVVENYMRGTYHTLDHLSRAEFTKEAKLCLAAVRSDPALAADVAKQLRPCCCKSCRGGDGVSVETSAAVARASVAVLERPADSGFAPAGHPDPGAWTNARWAAQREEEASYAERIRGTAKVVPFECHQCGQWHSGEVLERSKGQCPTKSGEAYPQEVSRASIVVPNRWEVKSQEACAGCRMKHPAKLWERTGGVCPVAYLHGIGRTAGRSVAYVRWAGNQQLEDFTLEGFKAIFGVSARALKTGDKVCPVKFTKGVLS